MDPRFRTTLWPGTILPSLLLRPLSNVKVQGDWIVWPAQGGGPGVELPHDFYLRELMAVRPDDLEAAADIMRTYGILFDSEQEDLEIERRVKAPRRSHVAGEYSGDFHRDEVRAHIETAQYAIRTWLAWQETGGLERLVEPDLSDENYSYFKKNSTVTDKSREEFHGLMVSSRAADMRYILNAALSSFSAGIVVDPFGEDLELPGYATVYSASFVQFYNHLVEHAPVKRCVNEQCHRDFVRQRGRSKFDQNRLEGVKYCSRECARAQAQRELRRRKKRYEAESAKA